MSETLSTIEEIDAFLKEFKEKAKIFGISYNIEKEENLQTQLDLELFGDKRDKYILKLRAVDYCKGPEPNDYDHDDGPVWIFGIGIRKNGKGKKIPIYIKIYISKASGTFCISFHVAKYELHFPYKTIL